MSYTFVLDAATPDADLRLSFRSRRYWALGAPVAALVVGAAIVLWNPVTTKLGMAAPGGGQGIGGSGLSDLGSIPLFFVENKGQVDSSVAYYVEGAATSAYFTPSGVTYVLTQAEEDKVATGEGADVAVTDDVTEPVAPPSEPGDGLTSGLSLLGVGQEGGEREAPETHNLNLDFVGAASVVPVGVDQAPTRVSYFRGTDQADWYKGLKTYDKVRYSNLWPGIDLEYSGNGTEVKYTFTLEPGADPALIRLAYDGADAVRVTREGALEVSTPVGSFYDQSPTAYQEIDGERVEVVVGYALEEGASEYGFVVSGHDPTRPLIIDPAFLVAFSFYSSQNQWNRFSDRGLGLALDGQGGVYIVGQKAHSRWMS